LTPGESLEARLPALSLVLLPGGALVAAMRTVGDLDPAAPYVTALVVLTGFGAAAATALRPPAR
jgi:hypothetical protein